MLAFVFHIIRKYVLYFCFSRVFLLMSSLRFPSKISKNCVILLDIKSSTIEPLQYNDFFLLLKNACREYHCPDPFFDIFFFFIETWKLRLNFCFTFLDDNGFFSKMANDSDEEVANEEDEEEVDTNWRKIRHEREMFISQQEVLVFDIILFFLLFSSFFSEHKIRLRSKTVSSVFSFFLLRV